MTEGVRSKIDHVNQRQTNMKMITIFFIAVTALISIAAGAAKIFQAPQELEFLQSFGLSVTQIAVFGVVQFVGGILVILPKTRVVGSLLAMIALTLSTFFIFRSGNLQFGVFSLLPIVVAFVVFYLAVSPKHNVSGRPDDGNASGTGDDIPGAKSNSSGDR